jgi:hypothetical protein
MPAHREVSFSNQFHYAKTIGTRTVGALEDEISPSKRKTNLESWKKTQAVIEEQESSEVGSQGATETASVDTCCSTTGGTPPTTPILYTSGHQDFSSMEPHNDYEQQHVSNPNVGSEVQTCSAAGTTHVRVDPVSWEENVLTVMMRKIPQYYTQRMLLDRVVERGFGAKIDFLYLPFDYCKRKNVGYGFVNFIDPKYALAFRDAFDETYLDDQTHLRCKQVRVHPASLQGFDANWQHFRRTKTGQKQDPEYSPLFFPSPMCSQIVDDDAETRLPHSPSQSTPIASSDSQQLSISNSNTPSAKSWRWEAETEAEYGKEESTDFLLDKLRRSQESAQESSRKPRPRADRRQRRTKEQEPSSAATPAPPEGRKPQQRSGRAAKDQQQPVARRNWRRGLGKAGATGSAAS